jgi:ribosomal protein S18 acetylase RimI-like enzyme
VENGRAVGYVGVVLDASGSKLQLSKIYIQKDLRGRGLGKAALGFIEGLCRERDIPSIRLSVNKNNSGSIAWYERMGFMNVGAAVQDIGGGFVMDDFIMEKKLKQ